MAAHYWPQIFLANPCSKLVHKLCTGHVNTRKSSRETGGGQKSGGKLATFLEGFLEVGIEDVGLSERLIDQRSLSGHQIFSRAPPRFLMDPRLFHLLRRSKFLFLSFSFSSYFYFFFTSTPSRNVSRG